MARVSRLGIVHGALALFAAALVLRAAKVQLVDADVWRSRAARQHFNAADLPAPRGAIRDASGRLLVESRELVSIAVAPREVRVSDRKVVRRVLAKAGVDRRVVAQAITPGKKWVPVPGRFLPSDVAPLLGMRGVHATPVVERVMVPSASVRRVVGRVGGDGTPIDGLELALDTLLRGTRGTSRELRDGRGRRFGSPTLEGVEARPGHSVTLTINFALQDIADRALADAIARMGASGGDIVILDPHDGAVLAMASRRSDPRSTASTALSEPFEPGSTIKPFIAAALIARRRVRPDETVATFGGKLEVEGRTIHDTHKADRMTLRDVISHSSNVGIVQFAERLTPREEFEALRDAGFGTPTGVPYPAESPGVLREPARWSRQSRASLAMGYELSVNALQLAAAYAAIANGGELLEPALVREVRDGDDDVVFRHQRRVVRRLMSEDVAREVREMLVETVSSGTAVDADLATFHVGGKTGTARRVTAGKGYVAQSYTASFVGMFPARDPQYVILVKIDDPEGAYYGGKTAAPVSKVVLEAAIAARDAALDRASLATRDKAPEAPAGETAAARVARAAHDSAHPPTYARTDVASAPEPDDSGRVPYVLTLPAADAPVRAVVAPPRPVPDVRGMALRPAVSALHRAGFRVSLAHGPEVATAPAAGTLARPGTLVHLYSPR